MTSLALNDDLSCKDLNVTDKQETRCSQEGPSWRRNRLLCVGAHTAKMLADTKPKWDEAQVNGCMIAAAAVQCAVSYPPEEEANLSGATCHFLGMWHTHGEISNSYSG